MISSAAGPAFGVRNAARRRAQQLGLRSAGSNMPRRIAQARERRKNHQRKKKPRARNSSTGPVAGGGREDNIRQWTLLTATSASPMWRKSHSKAQSPRRPREPRRMPAIGGQIAARRSENEALYDGRAQRMRLHFRAALRSFAQRCWPGRLPALAPAKAFAAASSGESANETATVFRSSRYWPS
jgi:hypothetical protein